MRRLLLLSLLILPSLCAEAQERFTAKFSLYDEETGGTELICGSVSVCGKCYRIETAEGYVVGDGVSRWIYSNETKELVIQKDNPEMTTSLMPGKTSGSAVVTYSGYKAKLSSISVPDSYEERFFSVDVEDLDEDVIITDLR